MTETFWYDDANGTLDPHVNQLTWSYDDAGRLTDEVFNHYDDLLDQTQHFTHDLTGNRISRTVDKGNNGMVEEVFTSLYDGNDRLTSEQADLDNDSTIDQTTAFGYTGTQQTSKTVTDNATSVVTQSTTYQYNLEGRMASVLIDSYSSSGAQIAHEELHFEYDPTGIRVSSLNEQDTDADGTFDSRTKTEYLIDAKNDSGYKQVLQETITDADTGAEIKKIVYTLGLDHIAQTTFESGGPTEGETLVFHMDGHGSTRVLTDMAAAIAVVAGVSQIFHFDAHGNANGFNPAAAATSYLYSGEQFNATTGQQYLRARYYNPNTGTFNRLDSYAGNTSDPQSLHKYLYTHSDPVNGADPLGRFLIPAFTFGNVMRVAGYGMLIGAVAGFGFGFTDAILGGANFSTAVMTGLEAAGWGALIGGASGALWFTAIAGSGGLQAAAIVLVVFERSIGMAMGFSSAAMAPTTQQGIFRGAVTYMSGLLAILGLRGVKFRSVPSASTIRAQANVALKEYVAQLKAKNLEPPWSGVAYDTRTGSIITNSAGSPPKNVHPELEAVTSPFGGVGAEVTCNGRTTTAGNCWEFGAANQLLHMGSRLRDIRFSKSIRVRDNRIGTGCHLCQKMFPGAFD